LTGKATILYLFIYIKCEPLVKMIIRSLY